MAPTNPNPQYVQEEDFRNATHPISSIEPNKALGTALTGVGKGLSESGDFIKDIGKIQEFNTRQAAENSPEYKAAKDAREQSTAAYENFYNQTQQDKDLQTGGPGSVQGPNQPSTDLLPQAGTGGDKDKPVELQGLPQVAQGLAQAKLDSRINQVLLTAKVDAERKRLVSQYPDHTAYIDHLFSQAGFGNTANAKHQALQQYFLTAQAGNDKDWDKALTFGHELIFKKIPGVAPLVDAVRRREPGSIQRLEEYGNRYLSVDYDLHTSVDRLKDQNVLNADAAARSLGTAFDGVVNNGLQSIYKQYGYKNFEQVQQEIWEIQSGKREVNPLDIEKYRNILHLMKDQHEAYMQNMLFAPIAKNSGTTRATLLGPDGATTGQNMIKARLYPIEQTIQAVENKDFGLVSHIPHMLDAMTQADMKAMMDDKDLGPHIVGLKAAVALNPQLGEKIYFQTHPGIDEAIQAFIKNRQVGMVSKGTPVTEGLKALIDSGRTTVAAKPLLDVANWIHNGTLTNDDSKRTTAKAFFDFSNQGNLKLFPQDRYEQQGKNRVFIPGREFIFKDLTSHAMTDEMKRLGPATWNMYKTYVDKEHGESIFLGQIRQLEAFTGGKQYKGLDIGWDDKDGHFHVKVKPDADLTSYGIPNRNKNLTFPPAPIGVPPTVQHVINQVNEGLDSYNYIAQKDGQSPTVYTLRKLQELHIDLGGFSGIPAEMLKAVQGSTSQGLKMLPGETTRQTRERLQKGQQGDNNNE